MLEKAVLKVVDFISKFMSESTIFYAYYNFLLSILTANKSYEN